MNESGLRHTGESDQRTLGKRARERHAESRIEVQVQFQCSIGFK